MKQYICAALTSISCPTQSQPTRTHHESTRLLEQDNDYRQDPNSHSCFRWWGGTCAVPGGKGGSAHMQPSGCAANLGDALPLARTRVLLLRTSIKFRCTSPPTGGCRWPREQLHENCQSSFSAACQERKQVGMTDWCRQTVHTAQEVATPHEGGRAHLAARFTYIDVSTVGACRNAGGRQATVSIVGANMCAPALPLPLLLLTLTDLLPSMHSLRAWPLQNKRACAAACGMWQAPCPQRACVDAST